MTKEERETEILSLQQALGPAWEQLRKFMQARKDSLVLNLVAQNHEETRGRIKELNDLLELPERLQQELIGLQGELP
jgi:hypothetical protein